MKWLDWNEWWAGKHLLYDYCCLTTKIISSSIFHMKWRMQLYLTPRKVTEKSYLRIYILHLQKKIFLEDLVFLNMLYSTLTFTALGPATSLELPNLPVVTSRTPDMAAPFLCHNAPVPGKLQPPRESQMLLLLICNQRNVAWIQMQNKVAHSNHIVHYFNLIFQSSLFQPQPIVWTTVIKAATYSYAHLVSFLT